MWSEPLKYKKQFYHLHFEMSTRCNAKCPHCPRFIKGTPIQSPSITLADITIEKFIEWFPENIIKQFGSINFCGNFGDPSNCPDFIPIIRYILRHNKKVKIEIRTNGGARSLDFWHELGSIIKDKHKTIFSVDGIEESNHLYRRNVKWDKLVSNIKAFTSAGGYGVWEYLVFKHNEDHMSKAKELCQDFGLKRVQFKRPIGFEDYSNNRTVPMPVYDKEGKLDYLIEPAERYSNSSMKYERNTDEILESVSIDTSACFVNTEPIVFSDLNYLETEKIKCKALREEDGFIEVYVSAEGNVRPCCHIGVDLDRNQPDHFGNQLKDIFYPPERFSLNHYSFEEIVQEFDGRIASKWNKTHEQGKCLKCSSVCGVSSQIDINRLYVQ